MTASTEAAAMRAMLFAAGLLVLAACSQPNPPPLESVTGTSGKVEGPPVNTLSHEQLRSTLAECMQYGKMDDPREKYSSRYCSAVLSAHVSEGYATTKPSDVDPSVNRLH